MKNPKFTLSPNQLKNLSKGKETIFADNQSLEDVIIQGVSFVIGTAVALLIATALISIFFNLIY